MKIATWNINGVKARVSAMESWLREASPDIVCLQEIKSVDEGFPAERFEDLGYNVAVHGQKGFNGVGILSKQPIDEVIRGLPGDDEDQQARYMEAVFSTAEGALRVASLYLPNGNPLGDPPLSSEKFRYKLAWMARLTAQAEVLLGHEEVLVLAGDYNVIAQARDAKNPKAWLSDALFQPETRAAFEELVNLGFTDAVRACHPEDGIYTFWDYQAGAWRKNNGIRIDHMLLSPRAADRLQACDIDKHTREWERPSDHVPVWIELDI